MAVLGIDYAWQHPDPKAIVAAGYSFVCRYYSRDPSKNLTRAEADALAAVGLWIVGNWEYGAQDALRGKAGGIADAQMARAQADACGQPRPRPTYSSEDWDVTPAQEATVTDYLRAWDSVMGAAQVGEYGGFYPVKTQLDAGVIAWAWQTRAWSGSQWEPRVNIRQTGSSTVGGVQVDVNEAVTADYGQWQPGKLPPIVTGAVTTPRQENEMIIHDVTGSPEVWALSGSLYWHVADPGSLQHYVTAGVPRATITAAEHANILAAAESLKAPTVTVQFPSFTIVPTA